MKKILPYLVMGVIIALFFSTYYCEEENTNKYDEQLKNLERERDSLEIERIKMKDSLNKEISIRESENESLKEKNGLLNNSLLSLRNKPKPVPLKDVSEYVEYFNNRYSTNENKVLGSFVGLGEKTSFSVFSDLLGLDNIREVSKIQTEIISNKDLEIGNLNKDKTDLRSLLNSCENSLFVTKYIDSLRKEQVDDLKKVRVKKYSFGVSVGADTKLTTSLIKIDAGYKGYEAGYLRTNNIDYFMAGRRWSW